MNIVESTSYRLARIRSYLIRLQGLRYATKTFANVQDGVVLERRFFGYRLSLDVSRTTTHKMLFLEGERFIAERHLIQSLVEHNNTVIDVGANIGYYLLMFASLVGNGGKVFCFEPEPNNLMELKRNIALNELKNVTLFEQAASDTEGTIRFSSGINGMVNNHGDLCVSMTTLDASIKKRIDLIKIDVEGHELSVLRGAQSIIRDQRPTLFVEVHPFLLPEGVVPEQILNFVRKFYRRIELFRHSQKSAAKRIIGRYLDHSDIEAIPACTNVPSGVGQVFWLVARP